MKYVVYPCKWVEEKSEDREYLSKRYGTHLKSSLEDKAEEAQEDDEASYGMPDYSGFSRKRIDTVDSIVLRALLCYLFSSETNAVNATLSALARCPLSTSTDTFYEYSGQAALVFKQFDKSLEILKLSIDEMPMYMVSDSILSNWRLEIGV